MGEDALLLRLGRGIDPALNARVHALVRRIEAARPPWLREVVPAYASLAVFLDIDPCTDAGVEAFATAGAWLRRQLDAASPEDVDASMQVPATTVEIPVCYAPACAPDLDDIAAHAGLSRADVVALHCAGDYRVAMVGFAPGFPYLIGLDPRLAMPRLASPRTHVPAGSVAIGGAQAGIYPRASPGGWRLVGRTPLALFDPSWPSPCLLAAGQRVRFRPIDEAAFEALQADSAA
nr:5-oxoprolinase subunit PxpB [Luteimonas saliphila]